MVEGALMISHSVMDQLLDLQFMNWLEEHPDATVTPVPLEGGARGYLVWDGVLTKADAERMTKILMALALVDGDGDSG